MRTEDNTNELSRALNLSQQQPGAFAQHPLSKKLVRQWSAHHQALQLTLAQQSSEQQKCQHALQERLTQEWSEHYQSLQRKLASGKAVHKGILAQHPLSKKLAQLWSEHHEALQQKLAQQWTEHQQCQHAVQEKFTQEWSKRYQALQGKFDHPWSEQQKCDQQEVQLPAAKLDNLHSGLSRTAATMSPTRGVRDDDMEQSVMSELAHTVHLKSKMATQEDYRKYRDEKARKKEEEEQCHAPGSVPRPEITRTESVKQLLAGVNKVLKQKVEPVDIEASTTKGIENMAPLAQSQQLHEGREGAYKVLKCVEDPFYGWNRNSARFKLSDGIYYSAKCEFYVRAALIASPGHSISADEPACHTEVSREEVPPHFSRTNDISTKVEANDMASDDLVVSSKFASSQDEPSHLEPSAVFIVQDREKILVNVADLPPVKESLQHVLLPISQANQTDMSPEIRDDAEGTEVGAETAPPGDITIQMEWETVDDGLGCDGWSDVEQEYLDDVWEGSLSSSDVEWATDLASEDASGVQGKQ